MIFKEDLSENDAYRIDYEFLIDESTLLLMEQICNGMPGGFFIYKAYGNEELIYVNRAMLRIFGCDTEEEFRELTHNTFEDIVHPDNCF